MNEKIGAQDVIQATNALRNFAFLLRHGENTVIQGEYDSLLSSLKAQLALWGGIEEIDKWIKEHDPTHSLLSACLSDDFNPFT